MFVFIYVKEQKLAAIFNIQYSLYFNPLFFLGEEKVRVAVSVCATFFILDLMSCSGCKNS